MDIEYESTREDFKSYNRFVILKYKLKKIIVVFLTFSILASFFFSVGDKISSFELKNFIETLEWCLITFIIVAPITFIFAINMNGRQLSDKGDFLGAKKINLNENGITQETKNSTKTHSWKGIRKMDSNKKYIFVFVDKLTAYVIPKRSFKDDNESNEFIKILEDGIKNAT